MNYQSNDLQENIFYYFKLFIRDDLKNECIERKRISYSEDDFKDYIVELFKDWGGKEETSELFWKEAKNKVKAVLEGLGVYKKIRWYLVRLRLQLGEYEKSSIHIIKAEDCKKAGKIALEGECHNEPDFSEFPENDAVWDGIEFIYRISTIVEIKSDQLFVLEQLGIVQ